MDRMVTKVMEALLGDPRWAQKWDEDRTWKYIRELYPQMPAGTMQQIADRVEWELTR